MIRHAVWPALGAAGFAMMLAGCSRPPLPPPQSQSNNSNISPTAMVEAIRSARASDHSVVQVTPLGDPSVTGYLDSARADENAGHYKAARAKYDAALKLSPEDPAILQARAEVEVLMRDFTAADADAQRSFELGPRVGGLCASNWETVLEIAKSKNDAAGVTVARAKRNACQKAPPPSF